MLDGVIIQKLKIYQDKPDLDQKIKPGVFMEILRSSDELLKKFGQSNFTIAYNGTIKAFHSHKYQDDLWFAATGRAAVVMFDAREKSPTCGKTQVVYAGENDYKSIFVPTGVVHGYKVLSKEPVLLFYHTTKEYNRKNPDEIRIDPFDKTINFNWRELK